MSEARRPTRDDALAVLREVMDPELPTVDVVGLGIVRDVETAADGTTVVLTPTFSGCPALATIAHDVADALERRGFGPVRIRTELAPAWSTADIDAQTRERLREAGIAPPPCLARADEPARCPRCGAGSVLRSRFGSTPCKSLWTCPDCLESFEAMKPI